MSSPLDEYELASWNVSTLDQVAPPLVLLVLDPPFPITRTRTTTRTRRSHSPRRFGQIVTDHKSALSAISGCNFPTNSCVLWMAEAMASLRKLFHDSNCKPRYALN